MMKPSNLTVTLSLLAVFASGTVVGALGHRLYMVRSVIAGQDAVGKKETPDEWRRKYVAEVSSRLKLDDGQISKLNQILDETRDQYRAVKEKYKPEMEAIHQHQVERVSAILSSTQKTQYDAFRAERDRLRKEAESKKPANQPAGTAR